MDIQKQTAYFTRLSYESRREKVLAMLSQLKWSHEIFAMFYTTLASLQNISDTVLLYMYQSILEIAEEIRAGRKHDAQNTIKKMSELLMIIKKQEEMERSQEWNPDDILQNM